LQHGKTHLSTKTFVPTDQLLTVTREFCVFVRSGWRKRGEICSLQWPLYSQIIWILAITDRVYLFMKALTGDNSTVLLPVIASWLWVGKVTSGRWCVYAVQIQHLSPFRQTMKGQVAMEER